MIKNLIFFETPEELEKLTGLSHCELWDNNFNLDDMDWGFCSDEKFHEENIDEYGCKVYSIKYSQSPYYASQLLNWMEGYCVGFSHTEYDNKHFYLLHHA